MSYFASKFHNLNEKWKDAHWVRVNFLADLFGKLVLDARWNMITNHQHGWFIHWEIYENFDILGEIYTIFIDLNVINLVKVNDFIRNMRKLDFVYFWYEGFSQSFFFSWRNKLIYFSYPHITHTLCYHISPISLEICHFHYFFQSFYC